jgi:hypothetical protein
MSLKKKLFAPYLLIHQNAQCICIPIQFTPYGHKKGIELHYVRFTYLLRFSISFSFYQVRGIYNSLFLTSPYCMVDHVVCRVTAPVFEWRNRWSGDYSWLSLISWLRGVGVKERSRHKSLSNHYLECPPSDVLEHENRYAKSLPSQWEQGRGGGSLNRPGAKTPKNRDIKFYEFDFLVWAKK